MDSVVEFFKTLEGKTAIVPHGDADGCASGALIKIILEKLGKKGLSFMFPENGWSRIDEKLLDELKSFSNVIVVDLGEKSRELMDSISSHSRLCWIDHHKDSEELKGNFVYYNPHEEGLGEYSAPPASYIVYNIGKRLVEMDRLCWMAAVGVVGDKSEKRCNDVIEKTFGLFPNLKASPDYGELAILRKMVTLISSGRSVGGADGAKLAAENFAAAGDAPEKFFLSESGRFLRKQMHLTRKLSESILLKKPYKTYGQLVICEISSPYSIQNYIASVLRRNFPDKVICVTNLTIKEGSRAELRKGLNNEANLREIAREIASAFPNASGGGHKAAAGIRAPVPWQELRAKILSHFSKKT